MTVYSIWYSIPYVFVFLLYVLFSLQFAPARIGIERKSFYSVRIFCIVFVLYLSVIFIGMRGYIFTDWISYKKIFDQAPSLFESSSLLFEYLKTTPFEKGFIMYMILLKTICIYYEVYQIFDYIVNLILLLIFLKKYSSNVILSIAFYFIFFGLMMDINLARNAKAILIVLNSIPFIINRKFVKFFICVIIALQFHISAILYLILYFLFPKEFNKRFILIIYMNN